MFRNSFKIKVGRWKLGDGSWEMGVGRCKFETCNLNQLLKNNYSKLNTPN